jgi:hypothetical protein
MEHRMGSSSSLLVPRSRQVHRKLTFSDSSSDSRVRICVFDHDLVLVHSFMKKTEQLRSFKYGHGLHSYRKRGIRTSFCRCARSNRSNKSCFEAPCRKLFKLVGRSPSLASAMSGRCQVRRGRPISGRVPISGRFFRLELPVCFSGVSGGS